MYEVYKITNNKNGFIYIGITTTGLKKRFNAHVSYRKSPLSKAIHEYGRECFDIQCIDTAETKMEACEKERKWTLYYKSNDPNFGYNKAIVHSLPGDRNPMYGKQVSEERKRRISESLKGRYTGEKNPFYGQKHDDEFRQKVCGENHWTARKEVSEATRKKMSAAQSGAKSNNHKACMCIETGETFPYVKAVTLKYGFNDCHIHSVCKGKRKRCGGFRWKYIDDDEVIHNK